MVFHRSREQLSLQGICGGHLGQAPAQRHTALKLCQITQSHSQSGLLRIRNKMDTEMLQMK